MLNFFLFVLKEIFHEQTEAKENICTHVSNKEDGAIESLNLMTADLKKEIQSIKGLLLSP